MYQPCQDSYFTQFKSFGHMLDYHRFEDSQTRWQRSKVQDLEVEPLDVGSVCKTFAIGVSLEAVQDTEANLGLAIRVGGDLYPVRGTAYKSLLDRAKIGGSALPKLDREVLASVLNACLKLYADS